MKKAILYLHAITLLFCTACNSSIKPGELYGKWKYIKLENPNARPPTSEADWQLKIENPSIIFKTDNELEIWFSGKLLSHGTFRTDGKNILFKEILPGAQTREFPFYVTQLTDKTLVFETLGDDGSRVTAVKQ